ncbi:MAG: hypothetical protein IT381_15875 [Deltaproteobacteria bacterium]|nr:hypothetical protein [Deltaproteobacteria bacterium]
MEAQALPPYRRDPSRVPAAWKRALDFWGMAIAIAPPQHKGGLNDPLAYIDLKTRDVVVNDTKVSAQDIGDCLEAIFAHELGHHLHYPHSLATQARLELLEHELLPIRGYSLLNLFSDFLINCTLAKDATLQAQLTQIYRSMPAAAEDVKKDPAFFFYLLCFEEAWMCDPYALTRDAGKQLEQDFPGARAEAQQLAEELPNLAPNLFTQFIYFASVVSRYQPLESGNAQKSQELNPTAGDHSKPEAGDYADALERSPQEKDAIKRALGQGWLKPEQVPDAAASQRKRASALPGVLAGDPKKLAEAMAIHYRRLAERYLIQPPKNERAAEPIIPSTLSAWEVGDAPKEIDWRASVSQGGVDIGLMQPLKRDFIEDDPTDAVREFRTRLEIYLDVSGSMPDPKNALNPMTLAAQVLAMSCVRHEGQVRALIYSSNHVKHWVWTRSEMEISRFLMTYIGGGTDFPFAVLSASVKETKASPPIRIVLTDSDFHANMNTGTNRSFLKEAAQQGQFITLLNGAQESAPWVKAIADAGARTICVATMEQFPKTAAALARALFERKE